jgi:hypothetical protein
VPPLDPEALADGTCDETGALVVVAVVDDVALACAWIVALKLFVAVAVLLLVEENGAPRLVDLVVALE